MDNRTPGQALASGLGWSGEICPEEPSDGENLCGGQKAPSAPLRKAGTRYDRIPLDRVRDGLRAR